MKYKEGYTNRSRRQNYLREQCLWFVREKMPVVFAAFREEAERRYRKEWPHETSR